MPAFWVIAEHNGDGSLARISAEGATLARSLAEASGGSAAGLVIAADPVAAAGELATLLPRVVAVQEPAAAEHAWAAVAAEPPAGASNRMAKECGAIAELRSRPVDCSKLVPRWLRDEVTCRAFFAVFDGNAAACRNFKPDGRSGCRDAAECQQNRDACLDRVAYGKAYRGKDVSLCGTSNYCRVMMGEGQQVVQKLAAGLTSPAGRWFLGGEWKPRPAADAGAAGNIVTPFGSFACAAPLVTPSNRKMLDATLNAAHSCLADIELALSKVDFATTQALDAQEEKLARLTVRLDAFMGARSSPAAPKPSAKK